MPTLEHRIIAIAEAELAKLRFVVTDSDASISFHESAKELGLSVRETLRLERTIRVNKLETLTHIAEGDDNGMTDSGTHKMREISTQYKALLRTALWIDPAL